MSDHACECGIFEIFSEEGFSKHPYKTFLYRDCSHCDKTVYLMWDRDIEINKEMNAIIIKNEHEISCPYCAEKLLVDISVNISIDVCLL